MSAVGERDIIRRDHNGVVLRYVDPSVRRPHHTSRQPQPSDRLRMAILKAERQLHILEIIVEHLGVSEIGLERIFYALRTIECALSQARAELGLSAEVTEDA